MSKHAKLIITLIIFVGLLSLAWLYYFPNAASVYRKAVNVPLDSKSVLYASSEGYNSRDSILVFKTDAEFMQRFMSPDFFQNCHDSNRCADKPASANSLPLMEGISADMIKDSQVSRRIGAWLNKETTCRGRDNHGGWTTICLSPDSTLAVFREVRL